MNGLFAKPLSAGVHPFHITDLEDFYSGLRDGNHGTTVQKGVRILDGAMNGPRASEEAIRGMSALSPGQGPYSFAFSAEQVKKAKDLRLKMEEMVGQYEETEEEEEELTPKEKAAAEKLAKEKEHHEKLAETGTAAQKAESAKWLKALAEEEEADAKEAAAKTKKPKAPQARFESQAIAAGIPWPLVLSIVNLVIQYLKDRGL